MAERNNRVLYLIARIGGWDGISFQSKLWIKMLLSTKKNVTVAAGELDRSPGPLSVHPFSKVRKVTVQEMSLESQSWLFKNSYRDKYDRKAWVRQFVSKREEIKKKLRELCEETDIIMAHNFSIKHLLPAAWAALYELAHEHPDTKFISSDADAP